MPYLRLSSAHRKRLRKHAAQWRKLLWMGALWVQSPNKMSSPVAQYKRITKERPPWPYILPCCPAYILVGLEAIASRIRGTDEDWVMTNRLDTTTYFLSWDHLFGVDSDCMSLYYPGVIDLLTFSTSKVGKKLLLSLFYTNTQKQKHLDHMVPSENCTCLILCI